MNFRRAIVLSTTMLSALCGTSAWAEQDDPQESVTVIGQRPAYSDPETSTGTRTDTALRDIPQSITVITDDLIRDQSMRTMGDVIRYVPGVTMGQGEGHRDAPTMRGNSTTADFFIDGVRDDLQYYRDLYNAERIEVLRGANAMIFGRGGGGGVINRVTRWADWSPVQEFMLTVGADDQLRGAIDLGIAFEESAALRLTGVYEDSDSYRDFVSMQRSGFNPTATFRVSDDTTIRVGYEYFRDDRTVDRGVPSQNGRPWEGSNSAFFGNPDLSYAETDLDSFTARIEHEFTPTLTLRNTTVFADYFKFYQNIHPNSAVNGLGNVALQGYNADTNRENLFNQTDLIWRTNTGSIGHTFLAGFEFGQQDTANTRSPNFTGLGSVNVSAPTTTVAGVIPTPLQTNNEVDLGLAAFYLQDQIQLSDQWQVILGVRFDRFDLDFNDLRAANADYGRQDDLVSPRAGVIYRPIDPLSIYAAYSVSYLPQSGDQFGSLDATTSQLDPEEFENIELGVKWDVLPQLSLTAAVYRLDRTNTRAIDPDTLFTVLTGAQRTEGFEIGIAGSVNERWEIVGGYSHQEAEITRTTTAAPAGRAVPLTPEDTFSLWNMVRVTDRLGVGVGAIYQSESFASISNAVELPAFTRVDLALTYALTSNLEAQLNIENLLDEDYWATAHNDNNIMPGAPTSARFTIRARF